MLNKHEEDRLQIVLRDEALLQILEKVAYKTVEKSKPIIQEEDDMVVGQKYRAYNTASKIINEYFAKLRSYRIGEKEEKSFNRER